MTSNQNVLIVGATPQGLQAALTLAQCGRKVVVAEENLDIDRTPVSWNDKGKRWMQYLLAQVSYHPLIEILSETVVKQIRTLPEGFEVQVLQKPRWVRPDWCVDCLKCLSVCPVVLPDGTKPIMALRAPSSVGIDKREPAPCRSACPLGMNPQGYVALISQGRIDEAYELIRDQNPLPGICGRICHHPCEKACRRQEIDEPIAICALKRFVTDEVRKNKRQINQKAPSTNAHGPRVAIIGSGPAGLTAAHDLAKAGFNPTLIEAEDKPGGLLHQGIAPYRLPRDVIEEEIEQILSLGVDLRLNSPIRSRDDIESLKKEGFQAIVLATGASRDLRMNIKGEDLENVHGCVSFLKGLWHGRSPEKLGKVAVIGGGNAAVEAARACVRLGVQSVSILYRRTRKQMPADPHEVEQAVEEGVRLQTLTVPVEFEGEGRRLARIRCLKMKLEGRDGSGRPRPVPIDGSDFPINVDTAIVSIGQESMLPRLMGEDLNIKASGSIDASDGETNLVGIYAGGDATSGPSTVVEAMASGRKAAQSVIRALGPKVKPTQEVVPELQRDEYEPISKEIPKKPRSPIPHRSVPERVKDMKEVIGPFSVEEAIYEASRCLQCGLCSECLRCEEACDLNAIRHDQVPTRQSLNFAQIIRADNRQKAKSEEALRMIQMPHYGKRDSWPKATITGRNAALEALSKTSPVNVQPMISRTLGGGDPRYGIFICSCNGTLNEHGQLMDMVAPLERNPGVAHVEILTSACHPEMGRRIEQIIEEKQLNGALIASCTCCHLDFACESCTDQRVRLKHRLFREAGYDPMDIALVNIKETCLLPYQENGKAGIERALKVIQAGLWQLGQQKAWTIKRREASNQALVLGATEAGIAAAMGLKVRYPSVVVVDNRPVHQSLSKELQAFDMNLIQGQPVRLDGQRGNFTLIVEKSIGKGASQDGAATTQKKRKGLLDLDMDSFAEASGYHKIECDILILGRNEFRKIPYKRDGFVRHFYARESSAFSSLTTGIPGVYMASWSQVRNLSDQTLGNSAASEAMEGTFGCLDPHFHLAAQVDSELCRGCGRCADICPEGAARLEEVSRGVACSMIEPTLCNGCGNCIAECPTGAIQLPDSDQTYFERVMDAYLG